MVPIPVLRETGWCCMYWDYSMQRVWVCECASIYGRGLGQLHLIHLAGEDVFGNCWGSHIPRSSDHRDGFSCLPDICTGILSMGCCRPASVIIQYVHWQRHPYVTETSEQSCEHQLLLLCNNIPSSLSKLCLKMTLPSWARFIALICPLNALLWDNVIA